MEAFTQNTDKQLLTREVGVLISWLLGPLDEDCVPVTSDLEMGASPMFVFGT